MRDLHMPKRISQRRMPTLVALLALASGNRAVTGQSVMLAPGGSESRPRVVLVSPGLPSTPAVLPGRLIRVIEDPNLGERWLLLRDLDHPAGPGRLMHAAGGVSRVESGQTGKPATAAALKSMSEAPRPVIHAGDRVILEGISAVAVVHLEAVALGSAGAGSVFNARLQVGGKIVRAVALATGRAALQPLSGGWR